METTSTTTAPGASPCSQHARYRVAVAVGVANVEVDDMESEAKQLTCERCGNKTDGGAWLGFVYVGVECLTDEDREYLDE